MNAALPRMLFVCAAVGLIGSEAYALHQFVTERNPSVQIQGDDRLLIDEFGNGVPVEQVFTMRGDGLRGVSIQLSADRPVTLRADCELRQLFEDAPGVHRALYRWTTDLGRVSGIEWHRIDFPPLQASDRRLYSFRVQVVAPSDGQGNGGRLTSPTAAPSRPKIAIAASAAHVPGAGPFLVGEGPWAGSLFLQAHAQGETAYDQFRLTVETRLPRPLRHPLVQACILVAYHWALLTYAYAMLVGGFGTPRDADASRSFRASASL